MYTGRVATGGTYDFESHSGTIRLTIPRSPGAQFRLETVRGLIQADFPIDMVPAEGARKRRRVEFTIGDGQAKVTARTFSGRILVKSDADPTIRRDSASIVRKDSVPAIRRDSTSAPGAGGNCKLNGCPLGTAPDGARSDCNERVPAEVA